MLQSQLNSQNQIHAINSLAVPVVTYSFGIIDWTKNELKKIDIKTRKLMTANKAHHPKASVDRLYLKRVDGGRGLLQIEESYQLAVIGLATYLESQPADNMLSAALKFDKKRGNRSIAKLSKSFMNEADTTISEPIEGAEPAFMAKLNKTRAKESIYNARVKNQKNMPLYGQFQRHVDEGFVNKENTWKWLHSANLKPETESFLLAAQDQCLPTKYRRTMITEEMNDKTCRMCGAADEHIMHILAGCKIMASNEYLHRHDRLGTYIHWRLCQHYEMPNTADQWYQHVPAPVITSKKITILWDTEVNTDRAILANKPDIIVKDRDSSQCWLIDIQTEENRACNGLDRLPKGV